MLELIYAALILPLATAGATLPLKRPGAIKKVNLAGSLLTSGALLAIVYSVYTTGPLYTGLFYADHVSALLLTVIAVLTFTATLFSAPYMEKEMRHGVIPAAALRRYYMLLNAFSFTMAAALLVENLGLLWVAIEATTLVSALLVAFQLNRSALEAAWKYVMVCTVGICLALFGTILLYYAQVSAGGSGQEALSWLALKQVAERLDPAMVRLAFVFILIGYGTKAGLAPMHTWLPDAHSQAPSPVSGLLSGALLSCALYALMRHVAIVKAVAGTAFIQPLLVGLGVLSVLIALPFLLLQHDIKRLFAYSSVEHMGIVTLALGLGTPLAVYGALLHVLNHAVAKSALFFLAGAIVQEYRTKHILRIRGMMTFAPRLGALFLLTVLCITGMPPFGVFVSKFTVAWAAFAGGQPLVGAVLLLLLAGIFAGMTYYCCQMVFGSGAGPVRPAPLSASAMIAIGLSLAVVTLTGLSMPVWLDAVLTQAAAIIVGG
ncbi:hydrogenase 4 subunit F [Sporolituus thermophilus]|uniref:Hydrogenase-4 component F n=1 Tax=Sporolituus thermophilus DSM 23256 TaxID=1123285 RepID=A0A1G7IRS9_9FIRM|nr:hydrogenase 4 subunit F [Sporolituus thermophilus]SDF15286.1 hydrogenase-4 component F [Sporolituus thermophilus DSM 23256]